MKFLVKEDILLRERDGALERYSVAYKMWFPYGPRPEFVTTVGADDAIRTLIELGASTAEAQKATRSA